MAVIGSTKVDTPTSIKRSLRTILNDLVKRLELQTERVDSVHKLLEPWAGRLFPEARNGNEPLQLDSAYETNKAKDENGKVAHDDLAHAHTGGLQTSLTEADAPSIVRATLVSRIAEIVLGIEGWSGPLSMNYLELCEFNWAANCHMYPTCILRPSTSKQVAQIVNVLVTLKVHFAIRSGDHQPCPGYASVGGDAVLIDINRMDTVELSNDKKTLKIGPGGTWTAIYELLERTGVSVIGGRTNEVGRAGLLLGGGYPSFSSQYGLVCDNVEEFELVLSDGSIVVANGNSNDNLF